MLALDYNGNTLWTKSFVESESDLLCESFLNLQSPGKGFGDTGEFRKTNDEAVGDVADVNLRSVRTNIKDMSHFTVSTTCRVKVEGKNEIKAVLQLTLPVKGTI